MQKKKQEPSGNAPGNVSLNMMLMQHKPIELRINWQPRVDYYYKKYK